jgi:hypothetical protein
MKKILFVIALVLIGAYFVYNRPEKPSVIFIRDTNEFYDIKADYPVEKMDKKSEMKEFVEYVVKQKQEEWKIGGEIYNAEQKIAKDFPDRPKMQYQLNISYTFSTSNKFTTTSYVFNSYEYTGGAHGGTGLSTFTFNKNGRVMIEDVLNMEGANDIEVTKLIAKKLETVLGENSSKETIYQGLGLAYLKPDYTLDKTKCNCDGFFFGSNLQNFVITDLGIKFIFGQYQVAPYAVGMPEVLLTYDELKSFIKDYYNVQITN